MGHYWSKNKLLEQISAKIGRNNEYDSYHDVYKKVVHAPYVETVFRCIDRRFFFNKQNHANGYLSFNYHIEKHQSRSMNAEALECLELKPGDKFLAIGSGIGYFNTIAGFLLGTNGVNHGIDIHSFLVHNANLKLKCFKEYSSAIDYYHFCEPTFILGDPAEMLPSNYYNKIYCPTQVFPDKYIFLKSLIKIGGILVMVCNGYLVKITRVEKNHWEYIQLLPILNVRVKQSVIVESCSERPISEFPTVTPISLQELCRSTIRSSIREKILDEHPQLKMKCWADDPPKGRKACLKRRYRIDRNTHITPKISITVANSSDEEDNSDKEEEKLDLKKILETDHRFFTVPRVASIYHVSPQENIPVVDESADQCVMCDFKYNRKMNKLSILMKNKITDLPIPENLKFFLNYDRLD